MFIQNVQINVKPEHVCLDRIPKVQLGQVCTVYQSGILFIHSTKEFISKSELTLGCEINLFFFKFRIRTERLTMFSFEDNFRTL